LPSIFAHIDDERQADTDELEDVLRRFDKILPECDEWALDEEHQYKR
jgi:hypothetical protein